jgi:zinc protease
VVIGRRALLLLATLAAACSPPPIVAPLRYEPVPPAPEEPFRASPPDASPAPPSVPLPFQVKRLPNGLEVALLERHALPIVALQLVSERGFADAAIPLDAVGILQRVMQSGTARRRSQELALAYARIGAPHRAFLDPDGCGLAASSGSADLDTAVGLMAEAVIPPRLDPPAFAGMRAAWLADFASREGDSKGGVHRSVVAVLFGRGHPYGFARPARGHTEALAPHDLAMLHAQLFHPAHTTLIVVGDATPEAVAASATRWLGGWAPQSPPLPRVDVPAAGDPGARLVFIERRGTQQIDAAVVARGPAAASDDLLALQVLARLLGGNSSRLRGEVRVESGAAYRFGAGVASQRGGSFLHVDATLDADKAVPALRSILTAIAEIRAHGAPEPDLERARTSLLAGWRTQIASSEGLASAAATMLSHGLPVAAIEAYPQRLQAVTRDDVIRAARRYLGEGSIHVVVSGAPGVRGALAELGLGEPEQRDGWGDPVRR